MTGYLRMLAQTAALAVLCAAVAGLSGWPTYSQLPSDTALLKLSFTHGSKRGAGCHRRTAEELAKLAPNMRKAIECPRTRPPVYVELDVDGLNIYRASLPPSGLSGDGPSRVYRRFTLSAGAHQIAVRMRDSAESEGFDYARSGDVLLSANQSFVVDFRPDAGGFSFE